MYTFNYATDVIGTAAGDRIALIERSRDGSRREFTFAQVARESAALAGNLARLGVERGDVVLTLIGNRPEWALAMVACFRIGAVVLPCSEQLRAKDLNMRVDACAPKVIIADERNRAELERAGLTGTDPLVLLVPDDSLFRGEPAPAVRLDLGDPCLLTLTSGTSGPPKAALHAQRYLRGQALQAQHWLDARADRVVWCTASSGWSKSARNSFIAPWLMGAVALMHDGRFDPAERLEIAAEECVDVLCMAPTEYRIIAKRSGISRIPGLRGLVAAGEALTPGVFEAWREATGLEIRDGYGQTETGQLTGMPLGVPARPGSMGVPLPGIRVAVEPSDAGAEYGEMTVERASVPTFFHGYLGGDSPPEIWRTGDLVRLDPDGYLYFVGRADDVIVSAGYRVGPFEVESSLIAHPAVSEAVAVAADDEERGSVVRAVVVLNDGYEPTGALVRDLQEHVKHDTAPYKYPRIVDFVTALPKTSSGKVRRKLVRDNDAAVVSQLRSLVDATDQT